MRQYVAAKATIAQKAAIIASAPAFGRYPGSFARNRLRSGKPAAEGALRTCSADGGAKQKEPGRGCVAALKTIRLQAALRASVSITTLLPSSQKCVNGHSSKGEENSRTCSCSPSADRNSSAVSPSEKQAR